jgi:hypothetical protein
MNTYMYMYIIIYVDHRVHQDSDTRKSQDIEINSAHISYCMKNACFEKHTL